MSKWECSLCTYENAQTLSECTICSEPKPKSNEKVLKTKINLPWNCNFCTFENSNDRLDCEMCQNLKFANAQGEKEPEIVILSEEEELFEKIISNEKKEVELDFDFTGDDGFSYWDRNTHQTKDFEEEKILSRAKIKRKFEEEEEDDDDEICLIDVESEKKSCSDLLNRLTKRKRSDENEYLLAPLKKSKTQTEISLPNANRSKNMSKQATRLNDQRKKGDFSLSEIIVQMSSVDSSSSIAFRNLHGKIKTACIDNQLNVSEVVQEINRLVTFKRYEITEDLEESYFQNQRICIPATGAPGVRLVDVPQCFLFFKGTEFLEFCLKEEFEPLLEKVKPGKRFLLFLTDHFFFSFL
jgi:predicted CopG family antitoxin